MANRTWGLNALGRSGRVDLEFDETLDKGPLAYRLSLALPLIELRFEVAGPSTTATLSRFLREHYGQKRFAELEIGTLDGAPILLLKDDEHPDGFFIRAAREGAIRVTIIDPDTRDLLQAAEQLAADTVPRT